MEQDATTREGPPLSSRLVRRLGLAAFGGLALLGLLAYFLVVHYRSARALRENLIAQRAQEAQLHAVALGNLFDAAAETMRNVAVSAEVDAYFKNRDLGMSMEYGLRLTLVPIAERLRTAVEDPGPRDRPVLARAVVLEEGGELLASSDRSAAPSATAAELARSRGLAEGIRFTGDGRGLLVVQYCRFKGRVVARAVGWLSPSALAAVLPAGQRPELILADADGSTLPPGGSPVVRAALDTVPPAGHAVEISDPAGPYLAVRVPVPGHPYTLVQIDRADELMGALSPGQSVLGLTAAALAVLLGAALAFVFSGRSLLLEARLEESVHSRRELEAQHRALQREVTARQRLEAAHARLAQAVDQAAEAIALTAPDGTFEYVNPAFERITGYGPGALRGPAELDAGDAEDDEPTLAAAFGTPSEWVGEVKVRRRDGAVVLLEVVLSPVRGPSGETVSRVLAARDVTEEHRLREQLRHSQRLEAVGTLAGGVAHDFNNLLSVINGYAGMALSSLPGDHPARDDVKEILAAGGRAATLTRQLLAFGRRQVLRPEVVDLNEVVGGIEKMLRRLIPENIELLTRPAASLRRVRIDPGQLEQVLVNLVVNARDAMPGGGRILVTTADVVLVDGDNRLDHETPPGAYVRVSVSDNGAGMDEQTRARCFEPFFTTKAPGKGTGLGLSTVYGIVRQSRGIVRVESREGEGATFELYLPVADGEAAAVRGPAAGQRAGPARPGETVLVVEDEAQLRELLRSRLAAQGYNALAAADGVQALEVAAAHGGRIDVLLSDVVMPHLSGPELARHFRQRFPGAVVVFMTGYAEEAVARHGSLADAAAVIEKPAGLESVTAVIRSLLDAAAEPVGIVRH
jgi:PAS domain S-box-containing protein